MSGRSAKISGYGISDGGALNWLRQQNEKQQKRSTPLEEDKTDEQETELKRKDYERELKKLHVELVKLQEWVRHEDQKICIVFEGRDGAGKGGTIKAITARVSPRIFRVVALPAPTEREKSQMYIQRYLPIFRREERRHL